MLTIRRSRSAANARQARMSSRVSCGKSARICCSLIPGKVRKHLADGDARSVSRTNFGVYDDPIAVVRKGENRGAIRKTQETGRAALHARATFQFAPRRWA